jgi:hypothetical protein
MPRNHIFRLFILFFEIDIRAEVGNFISHCFIWSVGQHLQKLLTKSYINTTNLGTNIEEGTPLAGLDVTAGLIWPAGPPL